MPDSWYPNVLERLFAEFEDRYSLTQISAVVRECRSQLGGAPVTALAELVERLARERLTTRSANPAR